jgi:hypothetical protein
MNLFARYPTLKRVIVNTKTDKSFRGVLWRRRAGYLVLRECELLKPGGASAITGEVLVEASNVDFMVVL